jgi:hypothetical protein
MTSSLDVDLNDDELTTEIQLLAELMVIASESSTVLDPHTIDATLGLNPAADPVLPAQRALSSR